MLKNAESSCLCPGYIQTGWSFSCTKRYPKAADWPCKWSWASNLNSWGSTRGCPSLHSFIIFFRLTFNFSIFFQWYFAFILALLCDLLICKLCFHSYEEGKNGGIFALPLLVFSHVYIIPRLKRLCELWLEQKLLNIENVIDIFQRALLCDAPLLSFICHRFILRNFKPVSAFEGWKIMKISTRT